MSPPPGGIDWLGKKRNSNANLLDRSCFSLSFIYSNHADNTPKQLFSLIIALFFIRYKGSLHNDRIIWVFALYLRQIWLSNAGLHLLLKSLSSSCLWNSSTDLRGVTNLSERERERDGDKMKPGCWVCFYLHRAEFNLKMRWDKYRWQGQFQGTGHGYCDSSSLFKPHISNSHHQLWENLSFFIGPIT